MCLGIGLITGAPSQMRCDIPCSDDEWNESYSLIQWSRPVCGGIVLAPISSPRTPPSTSRCSRKHVSQAPDTIRTAARRCQAPNSRRRLANGRSTLQSVRRDAKEQHLRRPRSFGVWQRFFCPFSIRATHRRGPLQWKGSPLAAARTHRYLRRKPGESPWAASHTPLSTWLV